MNDWLPQVEAKEKGEKAKRQKLSEELERKVKREIAYEREGHESNKDKVEKTYKLIETYVNRAASMKFNVTATRATKESLRIEPKEHSPKGYPYINLEPFSNKPSN